MGRFWSRSWGSFRGCTCGRPPPGPWGSSEVTKWGERRQKGGRKGWAPSIFSIRKTKMLFMKPKELNTSKWGKKLLTRYGFTLLPVVSCKLQVLTASATWIAGARPNWLQLDISSPSVLLTLGIKWYSLTIYLWTVYSVTIYLFYYILLTGCFLTNNIFCHTVYPGRSS